MVEPLLEIAANSLTSAVAAQQGGAGRVELCVSLDEGGVTPSHGLLAAVRERLRIPIYVLIRPRAGDFVYSAAEFALMCRDIEVCRELGCDGVVIGALTMEAEVDVAGCRELVEAAAGMGVTFHRAIDAARAPMRALEQVIGLGCERVLTSGAAASAEAGIEAIRAMRERAGGRIAIMAGAGLNRDNIATVAVRTGVRELHASARGWRRSRSPWHNAALQGLAVDHHETDVVEVRAMVDALELGAS